jgi:polar amino acid transport system substrate-binding protein
MVRIEDKDKYRSLSDLDVPGKRIAVKGGAAYDLWLKSNLKNAELVRAKTLDESYDLFVNGVPSDTKGQKHVIDAVAGLRPKLADDVKKEPGKHFILDDNFMSIQQALGCVRQDSLNQLLVNGSCGKSDKSKNCERQPDFKNPGVEFLNEFVEKAKKVGLVELLIERHKHMEKLFVAPPASKSTKQNTFK